jgi:hypothetical protein
MAAIEGRNVHLHIFHKGGEVPPVQRERLVAAVLLELWEHILARIIPSPWLAGKKRSIKNMNKIGKHPGFSAIFVGDIQLVREFPVSPFSLVKFQA